MSELDHGEARPLGAASPVSEQPGMITRRGNLHLPFNSRLPVPANSDIQPLSRNAVFLDRDGVLVEDVHFLTDPKQIRVLPGVPQALRDLGSQFYIIVVTNQSGIARGLLTEEDLLDIHTELVRRLRSEGAFVDGLYYCPHLPEASVPAYRVECQCRKPKSGMLKQARDDWGIDLSQSFLVGDTPRDIMAASDAGVKGIIVGDGHESSAESFASAGDLSQAVPLMLPEALDKPFQNPAIGSFDKLRTNGSEDSHHSW
jgi:D-glycero-D-manno-heptose 1,7-bisphosphate phosphatase